MKKAQADAMHAIARHPLDFSREEDLPVLEDAYPRPLSYEHRRDDGSPFLPTGADNS
jgi:hypothetical protein